MFWCFNNVILCHEILLYCIRNAALVNEAWRPLYVHLGSVGVVQV